MPDPISAEPKSRPAPSYELQRREPSAVAPVPRCSSSSGQNLRSAVGPTDHREQQPERSTAGEIVAAISAPDTSRHGRPKLLTVAEVAAFFGRTERTVRNWRSRGLLRASRIGRSIFFIEDEVMALLSEADKDPLGEEPDSNI